MQPPGLMETSKVRLCCRPEPADLTMDAFQDPNYSSGQAIGVAQMSSKPQFARYLCETSSRASCFEHTRARRTSSLGSRARRRNHGLLKRAASWSGKGAWITQARWATPPVSDLVAGTSLPGHAGSDNSWSTKISCSSTRSVGARMNTSHIMSGCCWLPLMKPITRRPVERSITASKR
jgi:hypothetical protein